MVQMQHKIHTNVFFSTLLIRPILKEGIVDEDHPEEDGEIDDPYDVERVLEVKDTQEVSRVSSCFYFYDSRNN